MPEYDLGTARGTVEIRFNGAGAGQAVRGIRSIGAASESSSRSLLGLGKSSSILKRVLQFGAATLAIRGVGDAFKSVIGKAADFDQIMSGTQAVTGASAKQMAALRNEALLLGKQTVFSASDAAEAIQELAKAGVSTGDILNGAAKATVNLAAAGGIALPEAATIAANALNGFGLKGRDATKVANLIAGAANASAIDVHQFGESLSQAAAVVHVAGGSFDDAAVAIAALGNAGIKGSDAGTSIKTLYQNLIPQSTQQIALFQKLGLTTGSTTKGLQELKALGIEPASSSFGDVSAAIQKYIQTTTKAKVGTQQNLQDTYRLGESTGALGDAFFKANGKAKSFAGISQELKVALKGQTDQQKLYTLGILFGSDAVRSAAVAAGLGAAGIDKLNKAMERVTAAQVAAKRLDNLKGSLTNLSGTVETLEIQVGSALEPVLKRMVDGLNNIGDAALDDLPKFSKGVTSLFSAIKSGNGVDIVKSLGLLGLQKYLNADQFVALTNGILKVRTVIMSIGSNLGQAFHNLQPGLKSAAELAGKFGLALGGIALVAAQKLSAALVPLASDISRAFGALNGHSGEVIKFGVALLGAVVALKAFEKAQAIAKVIQAIGSAFSNGTGGLRSYNGALRDLESQEGSAAGAGATFLSSLKQGAIIAGVTLALYGAVKAYEYFTKDARDAKAAAGDFTSALEDSGGAINQQVKAVAFQHAANEGLIGYAKSLGVSGATVTNAILGQGNAMASLNGKIASLTKQYNALEPSAQNVGTALQGVANPKLGNIKSQLSGLTALRDNIAKLNSAYENGKISAAEYAADTGAVPPPLSAAQAATNKYKTSLDGLSGSLQSVVEKQLGLSTSADDLQQAFNTAAETISGNKKIFKGSSDAAIQDRQALESIVTAMPSFVDGQLKAGKSAASVAKSLEGQKAKFDTYAKSVGAPKALTEQLDGVFNKLIATCKKTAELKVKADTAKAKQDADNFTKSLHNIPKSVASKVTAPNVKVRQGEVDSYGQSLGKLPKSKSTSVTAPGATTSKTQTQQFIDTAKNIYKSRATQISAPGASESAGDVQRLVDAENALHDKTVVITTEEKHVKSEAFSGAGPQTPSVSTNASGGLFGTGPARPLFGNNPFGPTSPTGKAILRGLNSDQYGAAFFRVLTKYITDGSVAKALNGSTSQVQEGLKDLLDKTSDAFNGVKNRIAAVQKAQKTAASQTAGIQASEAKRATALAKAQAELAVGYTTTGKGKTLKHNPLTDAQKEDLRNSIAADKAAIKGYEGRLQAIKNYAKELKDLQRVQGADKPLAATLKADSAALLTMTATRDKIAGYLASAKANLKNLQDARKSLSDSITQSLESTASVGSQVDTAGGPTVANITNDFHAQASKIIQFAGLIAKMRKLGYSDEIVQQVAQLGVNDGFTTAEALIKASKAQVADLNNTQKKIDTAASSVGNTVAGQQYDSLIAAANKKVALYNKELDAIQSKMDSVAQALVNAFRKALGLPTVTGKGSPTKAPASPAKKPAAKGTITSKFIPVKGTGSGSSGGGQYTTGPVKGGPVLITPKISTAAQAIAANKAMASNLAAAINLRPAINVKPAVTVRVVSPVAKTVNITQNISSTTAKASSDVAAAKLRTMAIGGVFG